MFRRIELIEHFQPKNNKPVETWKHGLAGVGFNIKVIESWIYKIDEGIPNRKRNINKNCKFYFTEKGWKKVGKFVVEACLKYNQIYKVIKIKENSVDVIYRNDYEVAVRPKLKDKLKKNNRLEEGAV